MLEPARGHAAEAAGLEAAGDLHGALRAYRRAYALDPSNGQAAVRIGNLQQVLRERMEASRGAAAHRGAPGTGAAADAGAAAGPGLRRAADGIAEASLRAIVDLLGAAGGINVTYDEGGSRTGRTR